MPDRRWKTLYQYWLSRHVAGRPPGRSDIDPPIDIPHLAGNLMLLDVVPEGYRYRLVGSEIGERTRMNFTGNLAGWVGSDEPAINEWLGALDSVVEKRKPQLLYAMLHTTPLAKNVVLVLPLVSNEGLVEKLLIGSFFNQYFVPGSRLARLIAQEIAW